jgi:hypothetical protein
MPTLDEFFGATVQPPHPRLRDWIRRLAVVNTTATLEVFRPKGEFGQGKPEMYVQFPEGGRPTQLDTMPWDDDLNAGESSTGDKDHGAINRPSCLASVRANQAASHDHFWAQDRPSPTARFARPEAGPIP